MFYILYYKLFEHETSTEWVLFVHGAGGSSSIWFKQIREYRKYFNVVLLDLRGHGKSKKPLLGKKDYTFDLVSRDIIEVMDHLKIEKAHFIGISLGTILIRSIAEQHPERVQSMVLGGAVIRITPKLDVLLKLANALKYYVPYMWLYRFLAWILMPKKSHRQSRFLFVTEAKKVHQKEFLRWFKLTSSIASILLEYGERDTKIPTLYIMGAEDYMFLIPVQEIASRFELSSIEVISDCGHVCNVDQPRKFNELSIDFIERHAIV
ncbi:alpha/beta fold hydrolase [Lysinibacillus sp. 54212]|uniref:alpha/beta fold hydrolase n=1 Tax=Lysinibacillus sp. 54212 TaxID=3119829 RepID=UPI002FC5BFD1